MTDQAKPHKMKQFIEDLKGIILTPGQTLGRLMKEKEWVPVFLLLVVLVALFTYMVFPTQMAKMAQNPQFAEFMPEGGAQDSSFARVMGTFMSLFGLFLSVVFSAFFIWLFFGIGGSGGMYGNYFSLAVNASVIDILLTTLLGFLTLIIGINFSGIAAPFVLLFSPDPKSLAYIVLSRINIFAIWYLVAVAAGVSVFSKLSLKKCMIISGIYFIFKAGTAIAFSYLLSQIVQSVGTGG